MRIISGKWGGRKISAPQGKGTRPTSERMRESVFSSLHSRIGSFVDLRVLDVFAGSGALGLEALSRGAHFLASVDSDPAACRVIEENFISLAGEVESENDDNFRLFRLDIFHTTSRLKNLGIDLAFFDPPYEISDNELLQLLGKLSQQKTFSFGAILVIERQKKSLFADLLAGNEWGFQLLDVKSKGDTAFYYLSFIPSTNLSEKTLNTESNCSDIGEQEIRE